MSQLISTEVLKVLSNVSITGNNVTITEKIDRKLYIEVNKVLEALGGKWNTKAKSHVFNDESNNAETLIDFAITTGTFDKPKKIYDFGYFPTPRSVALKMIEKAKLDHTHSVLEPSAGEGHLADVITEFVLDTHLTLFEIKPERVAILRYRFPFVTEADFLTAPSSPLFDRVLMNPPFENQQDIEHVLHAYKWLNKNGILVSVMGANIEYRNNEKAKLFREFVAEHGEIESLPEGSFKESGTMVNAVLVKLKK